MDSNAVIDFLASRLPPAGDALMADLLPSIATIAMIEIHSLRNVASDHLQRLASFISEAKQYALDEAVIRTNIQLRQQQKIKPPDAIIAATALVHGLSLNAPQQIKQEKGLKPIDPQRVRSS